ncbi:alpha-ketoglutarate-dependent taurine dioxygenase [Coprinopsis cinerea AmutBmut pab1-1]|nr:alpha-ketoglutarate-dependent taurine dioxygenase [Coprinopsis cinerea AmutBmut pab1-1]
MAPSVAELNPDQAKPNGKEVTKLALKGSSATPTYISSLPYPEYYLPHEQPFGKEPPLTPFEHDDPGHRADPAKPNLLNPDAKLRHLNPYLGTEVRGVQLSQLSNEGLDELALFVAERKVVVFREQDLKDQPPEKQLKFSSYFGRSHVHPLSVNVKDYPELAVIYRDPENPGFLDELVKPRINHTNWHSDVSYEKQPPGTTAFYILDGPDVGGDTLFLSQVEAYNRLSPAFRERLIGLKAVHTGIPQAEGAKKRGVHVRREPVESEHPVVRVHPVTKEKALYVNPGFTTRIVGFKKEESDALLGFLFDHITKGADFHVRASYEPGTVVIWDNRVTVHSAIPDFDRSLRRHHIRLTPQAEVPIAATEP